MKNSIVSLIIITVINLLGYNKIDINEFKNNNYTWSDYKWNYIWWWAMNLAWNELNDNILHEKLQLNTTDAKALDLVKKFNNPVITKKDLDESSYYIKSGYWQATIDAINKETKIKFPNKSFSDISDKIKPLDIISYAYFFKQVEYKDVFGEDELYFSWILVKWFQATVMTENNDGTITQNLVNKNVKIIKYENDDKFIIKIELKNNDDELILAKWYSMNNPKETVKEINYYDWTWLPSIWDIDEFKAPTINLDFQRNYEELINKKLSNKWFEDYKIKKMSEKIKFKMNKDGAIVENEGFILGDLFWASEVPKGKKYFILNKPYWVVMKRTNSYNPYFILGINNAELMEKFKW